MNTINVYDSTVEELSLELAKMLKSSLKKDIELFKSLVLDENSGSARLDAWFYSYLEYREKPLIVQVSLKLTGQVPRLSDY